MFSGEHPATQPVHSSFKREARPCGRLVEQAGEDAVLIVQSSAPCHNSLHEPRTVKQLHQQRNCELLRLDDVLQNHPCGSCFLSQPAAASLLNSWHCVHRATGASSASSRLAASLSSASGTMCVPACPITASHKS